MQGTVRRIIVVGGGTAGWITASLIAAEHGESGQPPEVILVESPDIPIIGVGEGTWPSMRMTLQKIGIPESALLRQCEASFKQGTRFTAWARQGNDSRYVQRGPSGPPSPTAPPKSSSLSTQPKPSCRPPCSRPTPRSGSAASTAP